MSEFCKRQEERLIEWAQCFWGQAALLGLYGLILALIYPTSPYPGHVTWQHVLLGTLACALAGRYRPQVLALTTFVLIFLAPDWFPPNWLEKLARREQCALEQLDVLRYFMVALVLLGSAGLIWCRRKFPRVGPARWPLLSLLFGYFGLIGVATSGWLSGWGLVTLYALIWALSAYLWHLAYALRDATARNSSPIWFQLATFHPFFGGSWLPVGLGAANLRQTMAKDSRELAVSQVKGIKLILNCLLMWYIQLHFDAIHAYLKLPLFDEMMFRHMEGTAIYSRAKCWTGLILSFFEIVVVAAMFGNLLVAAARMSGFRLLQQTYKPLAAVSVSDFWNRISYYYKQVVVDMFFYPSFLGFFKQNYRLRQAFAIFMAAGIGNVLFHFRSIMNHVVRLGLAQTLYGMQTYACYCVILCTGLFISQIRAENRPARPSPLARIFILVRIVLFYSLLSLFDELYTVHSPIERLAFLGYLCGL